MAMRFRRNVAVDERLKRLAGKIQALAVKDAEQVREAERVAEVRRRAAAELHQTCASFVAAVNRLLPRAMVEVGPSEHSVDSFRDPGNNVFQINFSGRVIHLEFRATETLTSTEEFHAPYTLEGTVRAFNQQMLDQVLIPEVLLFCCLQGERREWIAFDPRTHRATPFGQDFLIAMMEKLT